MAFGKRGGEQIKPAADDRLGTLQLPEGWRAMVGKGNMKLDELVKEYDQEYQRLAGLMLGGEMVFSEKLNGIRAKIEVEIGAEKVE